MKTCDLCKARKVRCVGAGKSLRQVHTCCLPRLSTSVTDRVQISRAPQAVQTVSAVVQHAISVRCRNRAGRSVEGRRLRQQKQQTWPRHPQRAMIPRTETNPLNMWRKTCPSTTVFRSCMLTGFLRTPTPSRHNMPRQRPCTQVTIRRAVDTRPTNTLAGSQRFW